MYIKRRRSSDAGADGIVWPPRDSRLIQVVDTWQPDAPPDVVPDARVVEARPARRGTTGMMALAAVAVLQTSYIAGNYFMASPAVRPSDAAVAPMVQSGMAVRSSLPEPLEIEPAAHVPTSAVPAERPAPAAAFTSATAPADVVPARLLVQTEPAGLPVLLDGREVGVSPISLSGVRPGRRSLMIRGPAGDVSQDVVVASATTLSVVVPVSTTAAPGWLTVNAPVELQMLEDGRLVGTSRMDRVMMPAGTHHLEFVNDDVGFRSSTSVTIEAGRVSPLSVAVPPTSISINAIPWADVTVDGRAIGQTPLADITLPAGPHEFQFSHPQLGEQRRTVVLRAGDAARLSVDLRSK